MGHRHRAARRRHHLKIIALALMLLVALAGFGSTAEASTHYRVHNGDNLWVIAHKFHVSVHALIVANHIRHPNTIAVGRVLIIPGGHVHHGTASLCGGPHGQFVSPVQPAYVTQHYTGPYPHHSGIDLAGPNGNTVRSAASGVVAKTWFWSYSYGHHVLINHTCGQTLYAHLRSIWVHPGQHVNQGQAIGTRDDTGNSTGPHLHFEIIRNGYPVNPGAYLRGIGGAANPKFQGTDAAGKLVKPAYDWRTARTFDGRISRVIQVARTAADEKSPVLNVNPCLLAMATAHLANSHKSLEPLPNVKWVAQKCHLKSVAAIEAQGHREPGTVVYEWLTHHGTRFHDGSMNIATQGFRSVILDPKWSDIAVTSAALEVKGHHEHSHHFELVFVGQK